MWWLKGILLCSLALIIYQDLKTRTILWVLLPITALAGGALHKAHTSWPLFGVHVGINLCLVAISIGILYLYARFKLKRPFLQETFGLGDALFFLVFAFLFPTITFLNFFVFSLLFSLIISLFLRKFRGTSTLPLAGYMGLFLIVVYCGFWLGVTPNIYTM